MIKGLGKGVFPGAEAVRRLEARVRELETGPVAESGEQSMAALREAAAEKLRAGSNLSREEVAAHLGVSTRKLQRMEAAGTLRRCPGLGSVVRYAARDVLRLASAR